MSEFILRGSYGDMTADAATGMVIDPGCAEYSDIMQVDVDEYMQFWHEDTRGSEADILDVGLWFRREDGTFIYDPPEDAWRADALVEMANREN